MDLNIRNKVHCLYLIALGNLGLGNGYSEKAEHYFNKILEKDINHQGAIIHKQMKNYSWFVEHIHDNQL